MEQHGFTGYRVHIETVLFASYSFHPESEMDAEARKGIARREMLSLFREWVDNRRRIMARLKPKADVGDAKAEDAIAKVGREIAILEMMIRNMKIEVDE